jgi:hypothetical protein
MADPKQDDPLLKTLEEIKRQASSSSATKPTEPSPGKPAAGGGDLLSSLLSEVRKDADRERAQMEGELSRRDEERRRKEEQEEARKREEYRKAVEEEAEKRRKQKTNKEDRERAKKLDEEQKIQEAEQAAADKIRAVKRAAAAKKKRTVTLIFSAVVLAGAAGAAIYFKPWQPPQVPGQGPKVEAVAERLGTNPAFKPMFNASEVDKTYAEPQLGIGVEASLDLDQLATLGLAEPSAPSLKPSSVPPTPRGPWIMDAKSLRGRLAKKLDDIDPPPAVAAGPKDGPKAGGNSNNLQLDFSAFGQKKK